MQCSPLSCSIHPFLVQISDGDLCRDLITGMDCEFVMNYDAWGEVSNLVTSSPLTRLISRSHAGRSNRSLISRSTAGDRRYAPSIPGARQLTQHSYITKTSSGGFFSYITKNRQKISYITKSRRYPHTRGGGGV